MSDTPTRANPTVVVDMGGKSDYEVMKESAKVLDKFNVQ